MASAIPRNESTAMLALVGYAGDSDSDVEVEGEEKDKSGKVINLFIGLVAYDADEENKAADEAFEVEDEPGSNLHEDDIHVDVLAGLRKNLVDSSDLNTSVNSDSLSQSVRHLSTDDIQLPPEPTGRCSNHLQEKISKFSKKGYELNATIQKRKDLRNPSIYEKLVSFLGIDEFGTNYPNDMFDPHGWTEESFYEALSKAQKEDMARREKERKDRTKVEFVSGTLTKKLPTVGGAAAQLPAADDPSKKRKTKWDQSSAVPAMALPRPSIAVITTTTVTNPQVVTVTTTATGTKTTVISAVGAIKKPKLEK